MFDAPQTAGGRDVFGILRAFGEDLRRVLDRLRRRRVGPVVAIDLTSPAIGVPAVRIVAPRLEGMVDKTGYRPGARARALLRSTR